MAVRSEDLSAPCKVRLGGWTKTVETMKAYPKFELFLFGFEEVINKLLVVQFHWIPSDIVINGAYKDRF